MKNNTNQIMKLNLPIWIKYWLSKHKNASYILSEILTGTEFFLQDSAPKKFKIFDIIGRTTQESTTGKNLANVPENWSFTRYVAIPIDLEAGDYIISIKSGTNNGTTNTNIFIADDNNNRLGSFGFPKNSGEKNANITINSKATKLMCYSQYDYTSGENITVTINQFMIRKASVTDDTYEPYTGGEPAPNPNYPYAIKNTGDNGSVNEKVQNKNLFDINGEIKQLTQSYQTTIVDNEIHIPNSTEKLYSAELDFVKVTGNESYTIKYNVKQGTARTAIRIYDKNKQLINNSNIQISGMRYLAYYEGYFNDNSNRTITIPSGYGIAYIRPLTVAMTGDKENIYTNYQIEQSSTPTSYVPHSEQNISFPLAQGQKLMEGDYPDDDEKVHHVRGKVVLIDEYISSLITLNNGNKALTIKLPNKKRTTGNYLLCNKAINNLSFSDGTFYENNTNIVLIGNENDNLETLKEKYNGAVFEYILAEEQTEDFTEEQKTAWEQIKALRTYKNITHITSSDETPANLRIQYYKEG